VTVAKCHRNLGSFVAPEPGRMPPEVVNKHLLGHSRQRQCRRGEARASNPGTCIFLSGIHGPNIAAQAGAAGT
jgi:hypothetical protein